MSRRPIESHPHNVTALTPKSTSTRPFSHSIPPAPLVCAPPAAHAPTLGRADSSAGCGCIRARDEHAGLIAAGHAPLARARQSRRRRPRCGSEITETFYKVYQSTYPARLGTEWRHKCEDQSRSTIGCSIHHPQPMVGSTEGGISLAVRYVHVLLPCLR